ncbi:MAG TPA: HlyD family efflux transporter periplasmic adaptor subunit, partial [Chroococcales cyanobacterium]
METKQAESKPQAPKQDEKLNQRSFLKSKSALAVSALVFIIVVASLICAYVMAKKKAQAPADHILVSGRIEGAESHLGARIPTQVNKVLVKEGDRVRKNQLLIVLDDSAVRSKIDAANFGVAVAAQSQKKALAGAASVRKEAESVNDALQPKHHNPVSGLFRKMTGAKKKEDAARLQAELQLASQKQQAETSVQQAKGEYARAVAMRQVAQSDSGLFRITSPIDGIVETRNVQPGDAVTPGQVLLTIVNLNDVYMRGFVPEGSVGKIQCGQDASIYLDSAPKQPLRGHVVSIDQQASFTPENVYFQKDRVKEAFGVKIAIDNPDGTAKP